LLAFRKGFHRCAVQNNRSLIQGEAFYFAFSRKKTDMLASASNRIRRLWYGHPIFV
jgi:hypothetical protein